MSKFVAMLFLVLGSQAAFAEDPWTEACKDEPSFYSKLRCDNIWRMMFNNCMKKLKKNVGSSLDFDRHAKTCRDQANKQIREGTAGN